MTEASEQTSMEWGDFAAAVAEIGSLPAEDVHPQARLIEDLRLDSFALAEVLTFLIVDFGMEEFSIEFAQSNWQGVTCVELYEAYLAQPSRAIRLEWQE